MQATRDLVGLLVELAAGVEHGHHHLDARLVFAGVKIGGDAVAVVLDVNGTLLGNRHVDARTAPGHGLIDAVIDDFLDQLVQSLVAGVADVHGRTHTHAFEPLEDLDSVGGVAFSRLFLGQVSGWFRH